VKKLIQALDVAWADPIHRGIFETFQARFGHCKARIDWPVCRGECGSGTFNAAG
jgi:hypothetical protein